MGTRIFARLSLLGPLSLSLAFMCAPAQAEMYVAGLVGDSVPYTLSDVEGVGTRTGLTDSDLQLRYSKMYGAKIGYYFDSMKWLGVETEYFLTSPHVMRQSVTSQSAGGASTSKILPGQDIRLHTWAPINVVVRHQMGQFEPYAGVGMGVSFAYLRDGATHETSDSTTVGLNAQVGLRYLVTKNISLIGDVKFIRTSFNFEESSPTQAAGGFKGDYMAHIVSVGLGYHF